MKDKILLEIVIEYINTWSVRKEADNIYKYDFAVIHRISDFFKHERYITLKQYSMLENLYYKWGIGDTLVFVDNFEANSIKLWFATYYLKKYSDTQELCERLYREKLFVICEELY